MPKGFLTLTLLLVLLGPAFSTAALSPAQGPNSFETSDQFLDYIQRQHFNYFLEEVNPENGLVRDRSTPTSPCSIAAVGFAFSVYNVAVERGWISRSDAAQKTLRALETLNSLRQGEAASNVAGYRGWFYHFLDLQTGSRVWNCELSSIDTALLLLGAIDASLFFDSNDSKEKRIRELAHNLTTRVDWRFMLRTNDHLISMEWRPERGHSTGGWHGYSEAACMYLLGLGHSKNPLPSESWKAWTDSFQWTNYAGDNFAVCPPLFTHQYSHIWTDFRGRPDACTQARNTDYFENSRRATLAQRLYASKNPGGFPNYSTSEWGWTACDGPGKQVDGTRYEAYSARGAPGGFDDGTIAPTAAISSMPFTPEHSLEAAKTFYHKYRDQLWTTHGFRDAYNIQAKWWGPDTIGIDQGPIILMIENWRSGSVWKRMHRSGDLQRGLQKAGFSPPPPSDVRADALGKTVFLTWQAVKSYQTGFKVEFSSDRSNWREVKTAGPGERSIKWAAGETPRGWIRMRSLGPVIHSRPSQEAKINLAMEGSAK